MDTEFPRTYITGSSVSQNYPLGSSVNKGTKGPGLIAAPALLAVEAAGVEPASASAPSVRFYEHSSRFSFALLCEPGRRREAIPLSVP